MPEMQIRTLAFSIQNYSFITGETQIDGSCPGRNTSSANEL